MRDDLLQAARFDAADKLLGAERPLSGSTPDINAFRIQNEYPEISARQCLAESVEAHLVIGRDQHGRGLTRLAQCIKAGIDPVMHAAHSPTGLQRSNTVRPYQSR